MEGKVTKKEKNKALEKQGVQVKKNCSPPTSSLSATPQAAAHSQLSLQFMC